MCAHACVCEREKRKRETEGVRGTRRGKGQILSQFLDILPFPFLSFVRNVSWSWRYNFKMFTMLNFYMVINFLKLFKNTQNRGGKGKEKVRAKKIYVILKRLNLSTLTQLGGIRLNKVEKGDIYFEVRYNLNFFGQENRGTIVTKAFEVTAKLWKYVTKIISTENTIMPGPVFYWSLGQEPDGLKDQFPSLNSSDG